MQRYVSSELSHFVGRGLEKQADQYEILVKILKSGWLTHPPHNPNISGNLSVTDGIFSDNDMYSPQVVCFCDIPVSDLALHSNKYSKFGLSFTKEFLADQGAVPVWYLPKAGIPGTKRPLQLNTELPNHIKANIEEDNISLGDYFDRMVRESHALFHRNLINAPGPGVNREAMELARFWDFCIFSNIKFFDHKASDADAENYYMEREWRILGNVRFTLDDVKKVFLTEEFAANLRRDVPEYIKQVLFLS